MPIGTNLRVLSYDIHRSVSGGDIHRSISRGLPWSLPDAAAVSRVIAATRADVACIQRAPVHARWRSRIAALARRSGMLVITGGPRSGGNLLLCRLSVDVAGSSAITLGDGRRAPAAAIAICNRGDKRFVLVGTRLGSDAGQRLRSVHELFAGIHAALGDDSLPVVLGAAVGASPDDQAFAAIASRLPDVLAATGSPLRSEDRRGSVFVDKRIVLASASVIASDEARSAAEAPPILTDLLLC